MSTAQVLAAGLQTALQVHQQGRFAEALQHYDQILVVDENHPEALHLKGMALHQMGHSLEGLGFLERSLALQPQAPGTWSNVGLVLRALGRREDALKAYEQAMQLGPASDHVWSNRGNVLRDLGRLQEALASYRKALELRPESVAGWHGLGLVQFDLKQWQDAEYSHRKALALQPAGHTVWVDLGNALKEQDRLDEALQCYDQALLREARYAHANSNRGVVLKLLGRFEEARESYERAIAYDPAFVDAYINCGTLFKDTQRLHEAQAMYRKALQLQPDSASAHLNLAIALLLEGSWTEGFANYEWRWKTEQMADGSRDFSKPQWMPGSDIYGKTLLLHAEQGLGDTLQFCRYAAIAAQRGARVVLEVQAPLVPLLRQLSGVSEIVARGEVLPAFDLHCPLLSAPSAAQTTMQTVDAVTAYLHAPPEQIAIWSKRLGVRRLPRIGVAWSGRMEHKNDKHRSMPFADFANALPQGAAYHCLQQDIRTADGADLAARTDLITWCPQLDSFESTAALIDGMDLVVAVDTSVAHLAAAMGKTVWVLLPYCPDWRWMLNRPDSPWYPTMRLFRQSAFGDWQETLGQVRQAIKKRMA